MSARTPFDSDRLGKLIAVLDQFRSHKLTTIHQATTLVHVAVDEGRSVSEYAAKIGVARSVMSSNLLELGPQKRNGHRGHGLITVERDPINGRQRLARLTPKGEELLQTILDAGK